MNYNGLKRAARVCLRDNGTPYRKLTLLFLLCLCAFSIPCDVVIWLLNSQLERLTGLGSMTERNRIVLWSLVISVLASLASSLWGVGYQALALRLSRAENVSFRTFTIPFRQFDRFLLLLLLEGVLIFLWSMLFMIPGIIAAYRYRMAVYAMLDDPSLSVTEALDASKRLTYGHKLDLFILDLSFLWYLLPLFIFSSLTMAPDFFPVLSGIGNQMILYAASLVSTMLWQRAFMPYETVTMAHAFNWLQRLDRSRREAVSGGWRE